MLHRTDGWSLPATPWHCRNALRQGYVPGRQVMPEAGRFAACETMGACHAKFAFVLRECQWTRTAATAKEHCDYQHLGHRACHCGTSRHTTPDSVEPAWREPSALRAWTMPLPEATSKVQASATCNWGRAGIKARILSSAVVAISSRSTGTATALGFKRAESFKALHAVFAGNSADGAWPSPPHEDTWAHPVDERLHAQRCLLLCRVPQTAVTTRQ